MKVRLTKIYPHGEPITERTGSNTITGILLYPPVVDEGITILTDPESDKGIITSTVQDIYSKGNTSIIVTRNSVYLLEDI